MSVVNLGLQSIGHIKSEMSPEAKRAIINCNSLKDTRMRLGHLSSQLLTYLQTS